MRKHSISTYAWWPVSIFSSHLSFHHLWLLNLRSGPMCPFEISNTKRGSVKESYIALILMATQAPMPHLSSVESNNNFSSRENSTGNESEEISVREGVNLVTKMQHFSWGERDILCFNYSVRPNYLNVHTFDTFLQ